MSVRAPYVLVLSDEHLTLGDVNRSRISVVLPPLGFPFLIPRRVHCLLLYIASATECFELYPGYCNRSDRSNVAIDVFQLRMNVGSERTVCEEKEAIRGESVVACSLEKISSKSLVAGSKVDDVRSVS